MSRIISLRVTDAEYIQLKVDAASQRNTIPQHILYKVLGPVGITLSPAQKDKLARAGALNTSATKRVHSATTPADYGPDLDPDSVDLED